VASGDHRLLVPAVSVASAVTLAAGWLATDQLAAYMPGPWFNLLAASVLVLSLTTVALVLRAAWRRHREGLERRALLWAATAIVPVLLAALAVFSLVESARTASVISGADVHLTRPLIESLPQPPGTKLLDEQPGIADTETISEDFTAQDLNSIVPFYEAYLAKNGWVEDKVSATTSIVRFTKGEYILSVAIDPLSSGYTLTVDRRNPSLLGSPATSASPTP
jgi:hypothetical protein